MKTAIDYLNKHNIQYSLSEEDKIINGMNEFAAINSLEIEIFQHTNESVNLQDCKKIYFTFYKINAISPYVDELDGSEYCSIHANGHEFISPLTYSQVKALIGNNGRLV